MFFLQSSAKELSYSEMDLRKPKRFATFSLGLGKKKKKHNDSISKSSSGLSSTDGGNEVTCDVNQIVNSPFLLEPVNQFMQL